MNTPAEFVCTQCHTKQVGGPNGGSPGLGLLALAIGAVSIVFLPIPMNFIVAGLCGGVMSYAGRPSVRKCQACGAAALVPTTTPVGREIVGEPFVMPEPDQDEQLRHFGIVQDGESWVYKQMKFSSPEAALMFAKR